MAALDYLFEQEFTAFLMSQQKIFCMFSQSLDSTQLISATSKERFVKRLSGILMEKLQRLKQFFFLQMKMCEDAFFKHIAETEE